MYRAADIITMENRGKEITHNRRRAATRRAAGRMKRTSIVQGMLGAAQRIIVVLMSSRERWRNWSRLEYLWLG